MKAVEMMTPLPKYFVNSYTPSGTLNRFTLRATTGNSVPANDVAYPRASAQSIVEYDEYLRG
jgi:hypothetical protein